MQSTEPQWLEQRCASLAACVNEIGQKGQRNMEWLKPEEQGRSSWTTEPPTAGHAHQHHKCLPLCSCCLQQLVQDTVFRVMKQRETLSIVYHHCPADLQLLVKTKSYSLQRSEQHNKNDKEDWFSPQFKGKCTKIIWHFLQASLQQKHHSHRMVSAERNLEDHVVSTCPAIHHIRLLSRSFSLALNIFRKEAFTVSLAHLFRPRGKQILSNI